MSSRSKSFVFFTLVMAACVMASGQRAYYEAFKDNVPDYFTASRADSLSVSPWHYKIGDASLQWDWTAGEELVIDSGIGDVTRRGGFENVNRACFSVWLYMQEPIADELLFEFREGEEVTGYFRFPLNFTGWRQARLHYRHPRDHFPYGRPTAEVDNIRVAAPETTEQGTVFFDFIMYNTLIHYRYRLDPEKEAQWRRPEPDKEMFPGPERVTGEHLAGIKKLLGGEESPGIADARVNTLLEQVGQLGITRDEHGIRGPGIGSNPYWSAGGDFGIKTIRPWLTEHGPDGPEMQSSGPVVGMASQIAAAYRNSNDEKQRRRLAEAFILIAEYLQDQGFHAGSGFKEAWGGWAETTLSMRDVLEEESRLQPHLDYLLYAFDADRLFPDPDEHILINMDLYFYSVPNLLRLCLLQAEETEQVRWLNAYKFYVERSMLQPGSALKIDGSAYHHFGHYHAYAQSTAFLALPVIFEKLSDTPWRLSGAAHERLRRAILAQRIYANKRDIPLALSGRSPFATQRTHHGCIASRTLPSWARMARLGTPDGKHEIDAEMAAAYLRLAPDAAGEEPWRSLGIEPEAHPTGTFVMPYAALLCHRRDDWMASVKGQSKYVWGSECYQPRNRYGYFMGLGHLEILAGGTPVNAEASGRPLFGEGWDWARFEGTTVPQLPLEEIARCWRSDLAWSPETFAGGLSHRGRQGVFAMILNQPMTAQRNLTGEKSWFFIEDQIIALGSGISCDEPQYPTQTTLCQKTLSTNEHGAFLPTPVNGMEFSAFPEERRLDDSNANWFIDFQQTGYYLPAGQDATIARQAQTSRDLHDSMDTKGNFLTAWIDHGTSPTNAGYEYMLKIRATQGEMQQIAETPPYRVVRRDREAHIIWHPATRTWGCAFFVPQTIDESHIAGGNTLPVKAVDRPSLVMAEMTRDGNMRLSVADPDLNIEGRILWREEGANKPQLLRLTLHGKWRLLEAAGTINAWQLPEAPGDVRIVSADDEETVLEIICRHGASYDISLTRL